jgi:hypothetical protein
MNLASVSKNIRFYCRRTIFLNKFFRKIFSPAVNEASFFEHSWKTKSLASISKSECKSQKPSTCFPPINHKKTPFVGQKE